MKNFLLKSIIRKNFSQAVSRKLSKYEDTILSPLKNLRFHMEHRDIVFVSQQSTRWTAKELDTHSDAFAYYLVEQGITGDKILFWTDVNHSLEYISAAIGTIKAGNTIVSTEYENWEDIEKVLKESKADALVVSPYAQSDKNIKTRIDSILESMPELKKMMYGDIFRTKNFPDLKQIIQISHKTIPGTEKFKHCMNYTQTFMTNLVLPELKNEDVFELYSDKGKKTITHQQCMKYISDFTQTFNLKNSNILNSAPIFYPASFIFGLMGGLANNNYNIIPGHYNLTEILKFIDVQKTPIFIGEDNLLDIQIAKDKIAEIRKITSHVNDVIIITTEDNLKHKQFESFKSMFENSKIHFYDEFELRKLD